MSNIPLPPEIKNLLGLGHKFIPKTKRNNTLLQEAYRNYARSVRIRDFFQNKPDNPRFDIRFHVKNPRWKPPPGNIQTEKALSTLRENLESLQIKDPPTNIGHLSKKLFEFAKDPRILIKPSDKNSRIFSKLK